MDIMCPILVGLAVLAVMVVLLDYLHHYRHFGKIGIIGEFTAVTVVSMCLLFSSSIRASPCVPSVSFSTHYLNAYR